MCKQVLKAACRVVKRREVEGVLKDCQVPRQGFHEYMALSEIIAPLLVNGKPIDEAVGRLQRVGEHWRSSCTIVRVKRCLPKTAVQFVRVPMSWGGCTIANRGVTRNGSREVKPVVEYRKLSLRDTEGAGDTTECSKTYVDRSSTAKPPKDARVRMLRAIAVLTGLVLKGLVHESKPPT